MEYRAVKDLYLSREKLAAFFAPSAMRYVTLPNHQFLTLDGLRRRVLSSSYMPQEGDAGYPAMMDGCG